MIGVESEITRLSQQDWDDLVPEPGFYQSYWWLRAMEGQNGIWPSYLASYQRDRLVATLPTYVFRRNREAEYQDLFGRDGNLLWCGPQTGYRNYLACAPDLDPAAGDDALRPLLATAMAQAKDAGYQGLIFDCMDTADARRLGRLAQVTATFRDAEALIDTGGRSAADFMAALPSKARRMYRRETRMFAEAGLSVKLMRLSERPPEAATLISQVHRKYGDDFTEDRINDYLSRHADFVDDASLVFACYDEAGLLLGLTMFFQWRQTMYGRVAGFDYPRLRHAFEYFNLAIYRPLDHVLANGLQTLHLGRGSWQAKAGHGARLRPLWSCAIYGEEALARPGIDLVGQRHREFARTTRPLCPRAVLPGDWEITPADQADAPPPLTGPYGRS